MKKTQSIAKYVKPEHVGLALAKEVKVMKNVEDLGTSMLHTNQQFYLLLQSILKEKFQFSEHDLKILNQQMTKAIEGLEWFEEKGLNPMTVETVGKLVNITMNHYKEFKAAKAGIALPGSSRAKKLLSS